MHVLVDATAIPANLAGVGRYVDDLLPALADEGVRLSVVARADHAAHFAATVPGARVLDVGTSIDRRAARMAWEQIRLPAIARASGCDVQRSPHYTMPVSHPLPTAVTLHDATFFTMPEVHEPAKRHFFRAATRYAVRHAEALVVPSVATRNEVLAHAGGEADRFVVAYHGVDTRRFHRVGQSEARRVAESLDVPAGGYIAFLGTLEPRKNVPALVRGWIQAFGDSPDAPPLVLAGMKGWDETIEAIVASAPGHMRVVAPGYLPLEDLPGFLSGAMVLAYPSLGEGFGLPVLEAMACGACALTTPVLSLPEVGGDAVAYCGTSPGQIAQALRNLAADPERRGELGAAAAERASRFTWRRSAAAHVQAFEDALRRRRG